MNQILRCLWITLFLNGTTYVWAQDTIRIHTERRPIQIMKNLEICLSDKEEGCEYQAQYFIRVKELVNNSVYDIRSSLVFSEDYQENVLTVRLYGFRGVQKVYWDGELIGQNGIFKEDVHKGRIGRYYMYAQIPRHLCGLGEHHLRVEYQQFYQSDYSQAYVHIGEYFAFQKHERYINHQMILMLAIFLISAMFFLIFFFGFGRKASFLFLSLYCIAYAIKSVLKPYQNFFVPEFIIPYLSYENSHLAANVGSIFLFAFLLWEIAVPRKLMWFLLFAILSVGSYFLVTEVSYLFLLMICSTGVVIYGFYQNTEGIWWISIGLLGYALFAYLWVQQVLGYGYFLGIIFFIVCMTVSVGQKVARQIKLRQVALLRSSTLENQLLKKSIQPHFILNSLASLQELIDQNPAGASDFVDQLADEFKLLSKVSNQNLIPIQDEIHMCRTHLRIMEYRKNAKFIFQTEGLQGDERVPPGIFHTLVENGITHGYGNKNQGYFNLSKTTQNGSTIYTFFNDGDIETDMKGNQIQNKGTGLKYIEARLRETYHHQWALESKQIQGGWEVKILIKNTT